MSVNIRHISLEDQTLREAFQVHPNPVPLDQRLALLEALYDAGLRRVQVGSLVRPDRIPQMADCDRLAGYLGEFPGLEAWVMAFNRQGLERAKAAGFRSVALSASLSEMHSRRNLNCNVEPALERCRLLAGQALGLGLEVRMGLQCAFGGPMLRPPTASELVAAFRPFHDIGVSRFALADTAARATPDGVAAALRRIRLELPAAHLGLHLHGSPERLLEVLKAACNSSGCDWLDVTIEGRGGCPFLPERPMGNLGTADAVRFLNLMGSPPGLNMAKLEKAGLMLEAMLSRAKATA